MRVNAENCVQHGSRSDRDWLAGELVRNLREMFDRMDSGDMTGVDEFRELFRFGKKPAAAQKGGE